ncbi:MAG: LOG family protein [Planctomycetota bacterium]|nr:LOG family protein [Planctomycetota bacterium]
MTSTAPIVSVFGSSSPRPGDADYALGLAVGAQLAAGGYTVQTGGYMGLMEATSRGAAEAGGHVIGVTSQAIEDFRPSAANAWVAEEQRTQTLHERLVHLATTCQAAVVLPGGLGTLTELALVWNLCVVGEIPPLPIVAIGAPWADLLRVMSDPNHVAPHHLALVQHLSEPSALLEALTRGTTPA